MWWFWWIFHAAVGLTAACRSSDAPHDSNATPAAVVRAWVAAVESADWHAIAQLYPASAKERTAPPEDKSRLRDAANHLGLALAASAPAFVEIPAGSAGPARREWYYCAELPPGKPWRSPCAAVAVVGDGGRWYMQDVQADSGRSTPSARAVCARLAELRTQGDPSAASEDCVEGMAWTKYLDGPTLWKLRAACMLDAPSLEAAYQCNHASHSHWPRPSRAR